MTLPQVNLGTGQPWESARLPDLLSFFPWQFLNLIPWMVLCWAESLGVCGLGRLAL